MDAPLVLTTRLNPTEVDKEALNVDSAWHYERWFYEATLEQPHPKALADKMDFIERRLGLSGQLGAWATRIRQRVCPKAHHYLHTRHSKR